MSDPIFGIHATALQLRSQRMTVLASNIANAATPGYKARDFDFAAALSAVEQGQSPDTAMQYRVPLQTSLADSSMTPRQRATCATDERQAQRMLHIVAPLELGQG